MKCDLCGKKILESEIISYDAVENSKLCLCCYETVTTETIPETPDIVSQEVSEEYIESASDYNLHDKIYKAEPKANKCKYCSATLIADSAICPNCRQQLASKYIKESSGFPVAGFISIFSIPIGIALSLLVLSGLGTHDSWGLGLLVFTMFFIAGAGVIGIFLGIYALNTSSKNKANLPLGIIGIIINVLATVFVIGILSSH